MHEFHGSYICMLFSYLILPFNPVISKQTIIVTKLSIIITMIIIKLLHVPELTSFANKILSELNCAYYVPVYLNKLLRIFPLYDNNRNLCFDDPVPNILGFSVCMIIIIVAIKYGHGCLWLIKKSLYLCQK